MFSFQALVLNGKPPHFGKANFITNKNKAKNINSGSISFAIFPKKFHSSVCILISVFPLILIHKSFKDVFSGFLDSKVLYIFSSKDFCSTINDFDSHVHTKVYHISVLSFTTSILSKSLDLYFSRKSFRESSSFCSIFSIVFHSKLVFD